MSDELTHIRKRLADEGEKTLEFFETLYPEDWERQVYTTGPKWRVGDILAHFISAEKAYQYYLQDILQGGDGAPDTMDIDQFNESEVARMQGTPPELLASFRTVREHTIQLTENLAEEDLSRVANHPWFNQKEVGWYLKLIYRHNTMHRMDIRKSIREKAPLPHVDNPRTNGTISPED